MKTNLVTLVILSSLAAQAELTYVKQGAGPYLWTVESAWQELPGGTAVGRVPTSSDDVSLFGAWTSALPLTIPTGTAATANTIGFGNATSGASGDEIHLKIEGSLTATSTFATNVWGTAGVTSVVTVAEGASFTGAGCDWIGATAGSRTVITNHGTMTFNDFHLVDVKNAEGSLDNYGSLTVNGECIIGARGSKGPYGLGRLHLHPGSTFSKRTGTAGDYTFFEVGSGVPGELVVESTLALTGGDQIRLGNDSGVEGHLVIKGDGVVTNATSGTLNVILGCSKGAVGRLTMTDNACLSVKKSSNCFSAADEENSKAYLNLSGNALVVGLNSGYTFGSGENSYTEINMADQTSIASPAELPIATGDRSSAKIVLSGNAGLIAKTHFRIGGAGTTAELCLSNNAYVSATRQHLFLSETGCTGTGTVTMAGGQIRIYPRTDSEYIPFHFGSDGATAVLRGYGSFPATGKEQSASRRCSIHLCGKMIASGFGEPQDLDATTLTMSNAVDAVNANGNSGWYAENGGRLLYPHTIAMTSSGEVTIGDNNNRAAPELVNSFHVKLTVMSSGHYLFASLYAPDRSEVPALPVLGAKDVVLGCWNMGYSAGEQFGPTPTAGKAKDFSSAEVTIRHATDFAVAKKLKNYEIVAYHCKDGGTLTEVGRQSVDTANPRVKISGLTCDKSGTNYNIGWIVLVAKYQELGLILMVR